MRTWRTFAVRVSTGRQPAGPLRSRSSFPMRCELINTRASQVCCRESHTACRFATSAFADPCSRVS